jgi:hypothetical protein
LSARRPVRYLAILLCTGDQVVAPFILVVALLLDPAGVVLQ